ncbi:COX15/CtaA family protein [Flavobacterium sp. xlx-214]|uniref:COX15/CtaA family protein n=1 Tax=unclassified Flavobacterium TaxID=196869 RepID=UPI0013D0DB61|nr:MULTISPECIES: COX15/CtaA family protein [unclassified Flavobacterium]MBA5793233.1 COX15/CtaA family protein [Flavobacterium sp. xlx-221]QMI82484.1 COX15/CtaA family protein [Flavobacterium sp. xlx-214]
MENKSFIRWAKITLVLIYLVIIAGATVRMTGSGMGCPDWPKCFGYYVPPTNVQELLWEPNHAYEKGQVIIKDEKLWVANKDFTSKDVYQNTNWDAYTKHDYAVFNVYHTWVEYINRLCGALAGLACLVLFFKSFSYWKTKKSIVLWSGIVLFLLMFNAWLGATVVYSVLNPIKITTHMIAALLNVAALLYLIHLVKTKDVYTTNYDTPFKVFSWVAMIFTLIQIGLGTQVRQFIDEQTQSGITDVSLWLQNPDVTFYIHRTFSFVIFFVNLYLFLRNKRLNLGNKKINWVLLLLIVEVVTGILMYYIHFPFGTQAAHLILAATMFGLQFSILFEMKKNDR